MVLCNVAAAQPDPSKYLGVRLSTHIDYETVSASYKFFIHQPGAIELNVGFGQRNRYSTSYRRFAKATGVSFSGAYQYHLDPGILDGLNVAFGGGILIFNSFSRMGSYNGFGMGLLATGGLDYNFKNSPLNLQVDFRPVAHITAPSEYGTIHAHTFGLAVRYRF